MIISRHSTRVRKFHWNSFPLELSFSIFSHSVLATVYLICSNDLLVWQITCHSDWYELGFLWITRRICTIICNLGLSLIDFLIVESLKYSHWLLRSWRMSSIFYPLKCHIHIVQLFFSLLKIKWQSQWGALRRYFGEMQFKENNFERSM